MPPNGLQIERVEDLDGIDEITTMLGICTQLVARDMRVVWTNRLTRERFADEVALGEAHCFERWGRSGTCPDCLPLVAFRTGQVAEGLRQRGRPTERGETYRVRAVPVRDPADKVRWVLESLVPLGRPDLEMDRGWHDAKLLNLAQASAGAPVVIDTERRIVSWSPLATSLFGYSTHEVLGRDVAVIVPSDLREEAGILSAAVDREGQVLRRETVRRAKDGRRVPVRISGRQLLDDAGRPVGQSLVYEDLSQVKRLRSQLEAQERLIAHVTQEGGEAVLEVDLAGTVTRWSRGAERLLAIPTDEILGRPLQSLGVKELNTLLERLGTDPGIQRARVGWRHDLTVEACTTLISGGQGEPVGAMILLQDISERLRRERQMTRSEKLAAVGSLAAGLAHEIGTPLNVISATAEYLLDPDVDSQTITEELQGILGETDRISKLVKDLLTFARDSPGGWVRVDPAEAVDRVMRLVRIPLDRKEIQTEVEVSPGLGPIRMEPDGLHQILLNLLLNAAHEVDAEGGRIRITAREIEAHLPNEPPSVILRVEDNGPGVDPSLWERIFDPFYTTRSDGTGLGLAVCARIVTIHHGDLRVTRSSLGGACFIVQLPVVDDRTTDGADTIPDPEQTP
jgi:PAS domain S-box-containing protein